MAGRALLPPRRLGEGDSPCRRIMSALRWTRGSSLGLRRAGSPHPTPTIISGRRRPALLGEGGAGPAPAQEVQEPRPFKTGGTPARGAAPPLISMPPDWASPRPPFAFLRQGGGENPHRPTALGTRSMGDPAYDTSRHAADLPAPLGSASRPGPGRGSRRGASRGRRDAAAPERAERNRPDSRGRPSAGWRGLADPAAGPPLDRLFLGDAGRGPGAPRARGGRLSRSPDGGPGDRRRRARLLRLPRPRPQARPGWRSSIAHAGKPGPTACCATRSGRRSRRTEAAPERGVRSRQEVASTFSNCQGSLSSISSANCGQRVEIGVQSV